jgi:NAD(P)-dependent dehydrogenase (short-subunit alcohol dehydrogenase family)
MGQAISSSQFFLYGKRHFTETGYLRHVQKYTEPVQKSASIGLGQEGSDGVDLTGRVIVVTGANSGVGKEVATYCASKGAKKVYMMCRSKDRAHAARDEILAAIKNQSSSSSSDASNLDIILADVGELAQVRRAVAEIQEKETKIDAIVCNAGVLLNEKKTTSEGNEVTFAAHFLVRACFFLLFASSRVFTTLQTTGKKPIEDKSTPTATLLTHLRIVFFLVALFSFYDILSLFES